MKIKYKVELKNGSNGIKLFKSEIEAIKYYPGQIKMIKPIEQMEKFDAADGRTCSRNKLFHQRKYQ